MLPREMLVFGIALPVGLSTALFLAIAQPWRLEFNVALRRAAAPLAVGAGVIGGHVGLYGLPAFPPVESWQWIVFFVAAATVVAVIEAMTRTPDWLHRGLAWLLLAGAPWLLVKILLPAEWSMGRTVAWLAALSLGAILFWTSLGALAKHRDGPLLVLLLLVTISAGSKVLLDSANAKLAQLAGVLASAVGPAMLAAWWRPTIAPVRGACLIVSVALTGLLMTAEANNFGDVPAIAFLLVAAAPSFLWIAELAPMRRLHGWPSALVRLVFVLVPLATAVVLSGRAAARSAY